MTASTRLARPRVEVAGLVEEAVRRLAELGPDGAALAGGTWLMRSPTLPGTFVSLHRIAELRGVSAGTWGALTTHAELAATPLPPALRALGTAARTSAFPQVRNVATLGGNLNARGFAEADLVPALLALDATVEVASAAGRRRIGVEEHLRAAHDPAALLVSVTAAAPAGRRSGYGRLTVRGGGEYSLASVAISADVDAAGAVSAVRVAVGSVEARARRCPEAEAALAGTTLDESAARAAGRAAAAVLTSRDDLLAPAWYRLEVLPAVFARAAADCLTDPSNVHDTGETP
ncbi:FAD binding domain-containing protein [Pseudonocardia sp. KRD-184]|uniref:FAD binding domain-containing protein n=1 Tax=Pseudonocardia oceani TaxID=2792013 RepID=A0ABS6UBK6_9PSEU|nr:FAD binding domain-containing protein [Pseudonocardia oceani]MBW0088926.1 FAD binding domain-containing protein [Pseudonocardia oceani]MBW0096087.1 FAD binding domain-containing protein [Pseudonocardia oceani]MBW0108875.1 FAD binding domain-containing protein [Pseudonocardia oceani]MBW0122683.1 FAD binding domain-containing protein [Pseudonocardia oceani]MBW0129281.1 FAD binding domain-containing protein [Pseudonocardia oceani]